MHPVRPKPLYAALLLAFGNALAFSAVAQEADNAVKTEDVSVFGQGEARQVNNVSKEDLQKVPPGTNPIKVLEKLPGVHFQSSDPFGTNEWSSRLTVRGFTQQYLGYTLDGIPLGDSAYAAHNGLSIGRAIIAEDVGRVTLSQGAGALGTASTSNLGGTVQFYSDDPDNQFAVRGAQTIGTDSIYRTYARVDTGNFASGTKAYLSALHGEGDNWKGGGKNKLDQINAKLVNIFDDNRLSLFLDHSDRRETDYQEVSKEMVSRLGWNWDNYYPDWQTTINAANAGNGTPGSSFPTNVISWDDAYWTSTTLRTDTLGGATLDLGLSEIARLKTTLYSQYSRAEGQWWAMLNSWLGVSPPSGNPFSALARTYHTHRNGITSDLSWSLSNQEIKAGVWLESTDHNWEQTFSDTASRGDGLSYVSNPFLTSDAQKFTTKTRQFYAQDTLGFIEGRAKATLGFKTPHVDITGQTVVGSRAAGSITASKSFLPQLGLNYQLSKSDELFTSYSENMRAFTAGAWGPFMVSQTAFDATKGTLKPETSKTYELGYRFRQPTVQGSLTAYRTDFNNRLLVISDTTLLHGTSVLANVGSVNAQGVEAALAWSPVRNWTWFNALSVSETKYGSNYADGGTVVATNGKQAVDSPKVLFNTELGYDTGVWFARLNGKYTDKRYYTYTNDNSVPSFWVLSAVAGYKQKNFAGLRDFAIQLNVTNLLDKKYLGTLGTNGYPTSDPAGTFPTAEVGNPRQAFLTISGKY